jgi:hypothetical protein
VTDEWDAMKKARPMQVSNGSEGGKENNINAFCYDIPM